MKTMCYGIGKFLFYAKNCTFDICETRKILYNVYGMVLIIKGLKFRKEEGGIYGK